MTPFKAVQKKIANEVSYMFKPFFFFSLKDLFNVSFIGKLHGKSISILVAQVFLSFKDFLKAKGYIRTFSEIGEAQADLAAAIKRFQE